jgi:uncharacterized membrane protein YkoI
MKRNSLLPFAALLVLGFQAQALFAAESGEAPAAQGSIRPAGKVPKADRPTLARVSFADALKIAQATLPGKVINGALEVEDGNLQYAFEIVGANKKIGEVEIDAGNGKVLGIDRDDND